LKEVSEGRGSPHGGVYLSFRHVGADKLSAAFGPVIDRLAANGIDLTREPVEVAPIAHYHMGGLRVDAVLETRVANLFAAGEAIGGANGANRLSGNAISEALVFGTAAGLAAAVRARQQRGHAWTDDAAHETVALIGGGETKRANPASLIARLQMLMDERVGPLRSEAGLLIARAEIAAIKEELGETPPPAQSEFDGTRLDWFDLRNMLLVAETVVVAALARRESRGAHQHEDHPDADPRWLLNQTLRLDGGRLVLDTLVRKRDAMRETAE